MRIAIILIALQAIILVEANPFFKRGSDSTSSDTCGKVNGQLTVEKSNGRSYTAGTISSCLCVSQLSQFVTQNSVCKNAVAVGGQSATISALTRMIGECSNSQTCSYPAHSSPSCQNNNPCYFSCTDGYSLSTDGKSCQCNWPYRECNGQCGNYRSCSSKRAAANDLEGLLQADPTLIGSHHRRSENMSNKEKRQLRAIQGRKVAVKLGCEWGTEACGVYGGSRKAWECVDTMSDLESCGGCMLALTPLAITPSVDDLLTYGTDCTSLPGVADVSCVRGTCAVSRCDRGWIVSSDATHCVKKGSRGGNSTVVGL